MSGRIIHQPHVHTRPPIFSAVFSPTGSIWACDCGHSWTLVRTDAGRTWRDGRAPWPEPITDDLAGALRFIRTEANRHRRALGLPASRPTSSTDTALDAS